MIELQVADLILIASRVLGLDTDDVLDLLDLTAAEQALGRAKETGDNEPATRAAALLAAILRHQPLPHGNRQVSLAAMLQFLAINGWDLDPDPFGHVAFVVMELADGMRDPVDVAGWLAPRLIPRGQMAPCVKENPMRTRTLAEKIKNATTRTQPKGMFQRFTAEARLSVHLAQEEARLLRHNYIGTEHLLLALAYQGEGVPAEALKSLSISVADVRSEVADIIGCGELTPAGHIPFTPRSKKVLELSLREALRLGHHDIGTEHILLGILREGQGVAAQVLVRLGADHAQVRERVLTLLGDRERASEHARAVNASAFSDLADVAEMLARLRRQKEAAFDAGDSERAAELRDRERLLLAHELRLEQQLTAKGDLVAVISENQRLLTEIDRLHGLLRQHGIAPDGGAARSA